MITFGEQAENAGERVSNPPTTRPPARSPTCRSPGHCADRASWSALLIIARPFTMLAGLLTAMMTVLRCRRPSALMPGVPVISSPG